MAIVYFEDMVEGSVHWGSKCVVDKAEMLDYGRRYDPWPFHIDEKAAADSPFGKLIASGGFIISLMYRSSHAIYNTSEVTWAFQGGVLEWNAKFHLPVEAGDVLQDKLTILSKTPSRKPTRGIVKDIHEMLNQNGERVFSLEIAFLVACRPRTNGV